MLGPQPAERARALRWRQGVSLLADMRTTRYFRPAEPEDHPVLRALGQSPHDRVDRAAWQRQRLALHQVRVDLGLERPAPVAVGQATPDELRNAALRRMTEQAQRRIDSYDQAITPRTRDVDTDDTPSRLGVRRPSDVRRRPGRDL